MKRGAWGLRPRSKKHSPVSQDCYASEKTGGGCRLRGGQGSSRPCALHYTHQKVNILTPTVGLVSPPAISSHAEPCDSSGDINSSTEATDSLEIEAESN